MASKGDQDEFPGHDPGCALRLRGDHCNCSLSYSSEPHRRSPFRAATETGPRQLSSDEESQIRVWIATQKAELLADEQNKEDNSVYSTLNPQEIRVLELQPGLFDSELRGTLHPVRLDFEYAFAAMVKGSKLLTGRTTDHSISLILERPVYYTALSYCWGPPNFEAPFYIEGKSTLLITKTLQSALQHLRDEKQSVWLWIDQICINQENKVEKAQQIPLMGLVYKRAMNTVIWLGDEAGASPTVAFDTLHHLYTTLKWRTEDIAQTDLKEYNLPGLGSPAWREVRQLFQRPWFKRLWVIQEVVLSQHPYVKCGNAVVSWDDFSAWCMTLNGSWIRRLVEPDTNSDPTDTDSRPMQIVPSVASIISELETLHIEHTTDPSPPIFISVLASARYAQAWEPKDKVYGLLGFGRAEITVDYSEDVTARQVHYEASLTGLENEPRLYRLLSCVDHEQPLQPSWVPDWGSPRVTEPLSFSTKAISIYRPFGSKGGLIEDGFIDKVQVDKGRMTLSIPGKIFDTIKELGDVTTNAVLDIDDPAKGNRQWIGYVGMAKACDPYPNGTSTFEAFWRTLVAGQDGDGNAAVPQTYSEVFSLILDESIGTMPTLPGQTYTASRKKGFYTLETLQRRKPKEILVDMRKAFRRGLQNRRFAVTEKRYFALVPRGSKVGDKICVFERGRVPFIVRPTNRRREFELLGESYVHGIMQGEVMDMEDVDLEPVTLV